MPRRTVALQPGAGPIGRRVTSLAPMRSRTVLMLLAVALASMVLVACGDGGTASLRIYTSVTQGTVDAVVAGFEEGNPGIEVEVFRAPTGELTARIAAEMREGGLQADLLWLTAYPIYQLVGTFRHEASHALAVLLQGAKSREFVFWPMIQEAQGFKWGYMR